ncbi:hypothetical protein BJ912DRAFT_1058591 [Pholiota molesta]|nr:hypothetical protein BJ912DRAFT_1058591 [Pholiota molesta]
MAKSASTSPFTRSTSPARAPTSQTGHAVTCSRLTGRNGAAASRSLTLFSRRLLSEELGRSLGIPSLSSLPSLPPPPALDFASGVSPSTSRPASSLVATVPIAAIELGLFPPAANPHGRNSAQGHSPPQVARRREFDTQPAGPGCMNSSGEARPNVHSLTHVPSYQPNVDNDASRRRRLASRLASPIRIPAAAPAAAPAPAWFVQTAGLPLRWTWTMIEPGAKARNSPGDRSPMCVGGVAGNQPNLEDADPPCERRPRSNSPSCHISSTCSGASADVAAARVPGPPRSVTTLTSARTGRLQLCSFFDGRKQHLRGSSARRWLQARQPTTSRNVAAPFGKQAAQVQSRLVLCWASKRRAQLLGGRRHVVQMLGATFELSRSPPLPLGHQACLHRPSMSQPSRRPAVTALSSGTSTRRTALSSTNATSARPGHSPPLLAGAVNYDRFCRY